MTAAKLTLPCPPYLPEGHFDNPARAILSACGDLIATYCAQTSTGAVFRLGSQSWMLAGPMALGEFLDALPAMRVTLPDGFDLELWLDAVAGPDVVADLIERSRH